MLACPFFNCANLSTFSPWFLNFCIPIVHEISFQLDFVNVSETLDSSNANPKLGPLIRFPVALNSFAA
jgi:hypothetical protein